MYYDIEVLLTQGWVAYARDLSDELDAVLELHWLTGRGHVARLVPHIVAM